MRVLAHDVMYMCRCSKPRDVKLQNKVVLYSYMSFMLFLSLYQRLLEESFEVHEKGTVFRKAAVSFPKRSSQKITNKKFAAMCFFVFL